MKITIFTLIILVLAGCNGDNDTNSTAVEIEPLEENIIVYIFKGNTQCSDDGLSSEESSQALVDIGIDVLETYCGYITGLSYTTVCGAGTGEIIAHQIREVNLESAKEQGYKDIEVIIDEENMVGYEISECENT